MGSTILENTKLVIFDVDGVIFDVVDAIRDSLKFGMEKYHLNGDFQAAMEEIARVLELAQTMPIPKMVLNSNELMDIKILEGLTVLKKLRIAVSIYSDYRTRKESCTLFKGIKELIEGLHSKGYKLAILSNNKRSYVIEALAKEKLEDKFNQILGFNEVSNTKPNPEGLFKILNAENLTSDQAIFIGDMPTDIQAGQNANIRVIAFASGLSSKEKLTTFNPFKLVSSVPELSKLLLGN